jgi:hypothetical protein
MISVSEAWKKTQEQLLLPESFLELSLCINDMVAGRQATLSATHEDDYSNLAHISTNVGTPPAANYATLEHNLWALDGTKSIAPDSGPYGAPGYVGVNDSLPTITLTLPEPRSVTIPGFTIIWSSEHGDYPTDFTIQVKNGATEVASKTITGNKSNKSIVELEVSDYDTVILTVSNWSLPERRARVDSFVLGNILTFTKNEIMDFAHEQTGDLLSGELPGNHIDFTLDNTDGRWNPSNPVGMERYLSERQEIIVRYGLSVSGGTEWIDAGLFYVSEWRAPSNGLEAHFVARDIFEFLLSVPYAESGFLTTIQSSSGKVDVYDNSELTGEPIAQLSNGETLLFEEALTSVRTSKGWISRDSVDTTNWITCGDLIEKALAVTKLPFSFSKEIDPSMYEVRAVLGVEGSVAEIIQMCANACGCVMWQDRNGVLNIKPLEDLGSVYTIKQRFSYSYPEVELIKPLKGVSVGYCFNQKHYLAHSDNGEDITVDNQMITEPENIAEWVKGISQNRKNVSGEFRADPRLDVFDVVSIESKYGTIEKVVLTNIKYTYAGSFKATYTGREVS